jgi:hypothetical protein
MGNHTAIAEIGQSLVRMIWNAIDADRTLRRLIRSIERLPPSRRQCAARVDLLSEPAIARHDCPSCWSAALARGHGEEPARRPFRRPLGPRRRWRLQADQRGRGCRGRLWSWCAAIPTDLSSIDPYLPKAANVSVVAVARWHVGLPARLQARRAKHRKRFSRPDLHRPRLSGGTIGRTEALKRCRRNAWSR